MHKLLLLCLYFITHAPLHADPPLDRSFNPRGVFPGVPGVESIPPNTFGAGTTGSEANDVTLQSNQSILLAGIANPGGSSSKMSIVKLNMSNGSLDTSFNAGGTFFGSPGVASIPTADFGAGTNFVEGIWLAIQSNGNYVIAGIARGGVAGNSFALARLTSNGLFDTTFNASGAFPGVLGAETIYTASFGPGTTQALAADVGIQNDQKIVVVGSANPSAAGFLCMAIVRLNTDGTPDASFNSGHVFPGIAGIETIYTASFQTADIQEGKGLAIQPDQKIVVVGGLNQMAIVRLNTDGTLDTTFNSTGAFLGVQGVESLWTASFGPGSQSQAATSVALQQDERIVVGGTQTYTFAAPTSTFAVARLNTDGTLDASFNIAGTLPGVPGIVVIPITDFGVGFSGTEATLSSLAIQSDGKIVLFGTLSTVSELAAFVRLNVDGTLDTSFNGDGTFPGSPGVAIIPLVDFGGATEVEGLSVGIQNDGKIVGAGFAGSDMTVIRLGFGVPCTFSLNDISQAIFDKYC